jgi:uncharacterized protein (TIGR01777 family)
MTVLITGSSGLIGTALVRELTAHGHDVVRLVRSGSSPSGGTGAPTVDWDPARGSIDLAALEAAGPYEGVVHLAGAGVGDKRWNDARKAVILDSRTSSTELLVTSLLQLSPRPPVLVSASAIGYYGNRADEELTEESSKGPGFLADVAAAWERATGPAEDAGIRVVHLRTGLVLAPKGGVLGKQLPLFRIGAGGRLGPGTQYMSWITLADEVAVILRALTDGRYEGALNAVAPTPVTNAEFTASLAGALHRPSFAHVPAAALRLALGTEMADETALVSQRVLPTVLAANGFEFGSATLDEAWDVVLGH